MPCSVPKIYRIQKRHTKVLISKVKINVSVKSFIPYITEYSWICRLNLVIYGDYF